jgi:hypothetical protein
MEMERDKDMRHETREDQKGSLPNMQSAHSGYARTGSYTLPLLGK